MEIVYLVWYQDLCPLYRTLPSCTITESQYMHGTDVEV